MTQILVNYDPSERKYLPIIASILKRYGINAKASPEVFDISGLLLAAKKVSADGILLANEGTLQNCVNTVTKSQATLDKFRGSRLNFSTPAIVSPSLSIIHTAPYGSFLLENDIKKFKHLKKPPLQLCFKVCETQQDFSEAISVLNNCILVSGDIETDGHSRITCVAFTGLQQNLTTRTFVIPFIDFGKDHWILEDDYKKAIQCMQNICHNPVPKMFYNGNYDCQYLIRYHAEPHNWVIDVMGLLHSQYAELEKNLAFAASINCYDYYYWKLEAALSQKNSEIRSYWGYCAKDSWYPVRIFLNMIQEDYPSYAIKNYQQLFKLCYPCIYCAYEGFKVEEKERIKAKEESENEMQKRLKDLRTMSCNPNFNPGSWQQISYFLYDVIGASPTTIRNPQTGNYEKKKSTDKKILLNKIAPQHPLLSRIIDDIITYREENKAVGTYFDFEQYKLSDGTGRLLYSMSPFTTDTGRFSSRQSNFRILTNGDATSYGTQIQNQPHYAKTFLIADDGFELAEADKNKSEARCVALLSGCIKMQTALEFQEKDFYCTLGTLFFGIKYEDVTKELRNDVLKRIVHASNYMLGPDTFILNVGPKKIYEGAALLGKQITDLNAFVKWLLEVYHRPFPEIRRHWLEIKNEVIRTKKLVSPLGYTRYFFGNIQEDHNVLRAAIAHEPQNLSVALLNRGFYKIYRDVVLPSDGNCRLKAQIHDSVVIQYKKEKKETYRDAILNCLYEPINVKGQQLLIPSDLKVGTVWANMKEP